MNTIYHSTLEHSAEKNPKACIFCGSQKNISKEHLFGLWLKEFFPRDITTTHLTKKFDWPDALRNAGPANQQKSRQGHVGSKKVRVVCENCNNQWMSELENRAKSGLPPLVGGQKCSILPGGQKLLSTWAAKRQCWLSLQTSKQAKMRHKNIAHG